MAHKSVASVLTALSVGFALASCAFQPNSSTPPLAMQKKIQPKVLTEPGKKLSAVGTDSDCVLTTGEIHLWCKWISRYY
jgi:hypothetical protein